MISYGSFVGLSEFVLNLSARNVVVLVSVVLADQFSCTEKYITYSHGLLFLVCVG